MKVTKEQLRQIIREAINESQRYGFPLWYYYDGTHVYLSTNHSRKFWESDFDRILDALEDAKEQGYDTVIQEIMGEQQEEMPLDELIKDIDEARMQAQAY